VDCLVHLPNPGMQDHRKDILDAGLAILQEHGLAGLTQPRVAARTGLRQSHLTYYYPTRADLVTAVARVGIEAQLAAIRSLVNGATSAKKAASTMAAATVLHKNTRVLAALNQAADQEPAVHTLFNELLGEFTGELAALLSKLDLTADESGIDLIHALFVGLSIIDLATARKRGKARAEAVLNLAFTLLSGEKQ
jgi:AcrR family transcriptional regulator